MKYHTLLFLKIRKDVANLLSAAVVTGALRFHVILLNVYSFSVKILHYYRFLQSGDLSLMMIFGYLFLIVLCFYLCVLAFCSTMFV